MAIAVRQAQPHALTRYILTWFNQDELISPQVPLCELSATPINSLLLGSSLSKFFQDLPIIPRNHIYMSAHMRIIHPSIGTPRAAVLIDAAGILGRPLKRGALHPRMITSHD